MAIIVNVFTYAGAGGNPCPIVPDAAGWPAEAMQAVAQEYGHESGFVLPATTKDYDYSFRFWVPQHEMEMCGHATIGALWILASRGLLNPGNQVRIETLSGPVSGFVGVEKGGAPGIEITQPAGKVANLSRQQEEDVLATLRIGRSDLLDVPIQNAVTSRVKTLIPIKNCELLHAITTDMKLTEACCNRIGSTGLYPYAVVDRSKRVFEARQFPRSSGYPEDAATGIAAAALAFGLLRNGMLDADDQPIRIFQGRAMGQLSEIRVRLGLVEGRAIGCLLGGTVRYAKEHVSKNAEAARNERRLSKIPPRT